MRIAISGGGTGGHIYPALTIAKEIAGLSADCDVLFIGTKQGLEADIIPKEGFNFVTINARGLERRPTLENIKALLATTSGVWSSLSILRSFKPDVAIGTGGFVCGPVLLAAGILKIPALIQEQNAIPGVTNKILARFVDKIAVGYKEAEKHFKCRKEKIIVTGNPIRPEILSADKEAGQEALGLDKKKLTLLVAGGSRGARSINTAMLEVYKYFVEKDMKDSIQILHVTGKTEYNSIVDNIKQLGIDLSSVGNIIIKPYLYNMPEALAAADLAVFRAGAVGLSELAARGIPSILIPYPYAAENHQEFNARVFEKEGAAIVIKDRELNGLELAKTIDELTTEKNRDKLKKMANNSKKLGCPQAASNIARLALSLGNK